MLNTEAMAYSADVNNTANELLDLQNYDGGFGLSKNYASDILDTEIALRALQEVGETDAMYNAARYVVSCQNEDGGFGYQPGLASNAELSAEIANILADCVNSDQSLSYEISEGIVKYEGMGTLKKGEPPAKIYRGNGATIVIKPDGEFVTILETGKGLDLAIQMITGN